MRSRFRFTKPAARAACTARKVARGEWRRPRTRNSSGVKLWAPRDRRLKPARLSMASLAGERAPGLASKRYLRVGLQAQAVLDLF